MDRRSPSHTNFSAIKVPMGDCPVNIDSKERIVSVVAGIAVIGAALKSRSAMTPTLVFLGGLLVRRGASGHCKTYRRLGINTANQNLR